MGRLPVSLDDYIYLAVAISTLAVFWRWHVNPENHFNVMDLVCTDGAVNDKKFMRFGSWVVMTLGFYTLSMHHPKELVWYAPLYGSLWVGAAALDKWQREHPSAANDGDGGSGDAVRRGV